MKLTEALELHNELNPKLWTSNNKLKKNVYHKLMSIYYEFIEFIDIPINVVDVEIVGSNASYNYNDKSDIDLHIIVNSELTYMDSELLQQFYNSKKGSFNDNYDINIEDIPVEVYIEDIKANNATNGRYSILKNKWVKEPEKIDYVIPDISEPLQKYIDRSNELLANEDDEALRVFINQIYMMRKLSLADYGEAGVGNLVFKELRNRDILKQLKDRYYLLRSEELSE